MNNINLRSPNMADLLAGLASSEDATRKMAAFKLQTLTNDPAFAEHFCAQGGLPRLRDVILESSGNMLAYSLASFARLLEVDHGWDGVDSEVVQKVRVPGPIDSSFSRLIFSAGSGISCLSASCEYPEGRHGGACLHCLKTA